MSLANTPLFQRLLSASPFSEQELVVLVATASTRYKDHYIEKRNGRGKRLISQPTKEVKFLQRLLMQNELVGLPIHEAATAYRKGHSIKSHADKHAASRYLLKLDFQDFFHSLYGDALDYMLEQDTKFSKTERWLICNLLCRRLPKTSILRLSIGAPSSPLISNYMLHVFDAELATFCHTNGVNYTRYADDIALSTNTPRLLNRIEIEVRRLLEKLVHLRLTVNERKTVNVSKKRQRKLVGLTLSNDGHVSVGRDEKRRLRATFHAFSIGKLPLQDISNLKGKLAYVFSIDPEFVTQLCQKYGVEKLHLIGNQ